MSLNGLDAAAVAEAHQAAQADAGGWFLLKYINRDTVEVLGRGTGGVAGVRGVIEKYEEKSPLYGLVQYRRKKVVLKYVPEGTSRLLQVRLTVQFQSVLETLTPHDTVFSFTAASELTESALSMSTMALPSTGSLNSSSSSLRKRRLDEISEDAEDAAVLEEDGKGKRTANDVLGFSFPVPIPELVPLPLTPISTTAYGRHELDELPASAVLAKALLAKRKEEAAASAAALAGNSNSDAPPQEKVLRPPRKESLLASPKLSVSPLPSPLLSNITDKSLPATPEPTPPSTSEGEAPRAPDFDATSNILLGTTTPAADSSSPSTLRPPHTRHLSAADQDSISIWSSNVTSYSTVKPKKKKLAPRPHVEPSARPKTSGTSDSNTGVRPVANLPSSIRVNNKSLVSLGLRPGSQQSTRSVPGRFATSSQSTIGVPPLPSPSFLSPPYSPGDSRSSVIRPASVTGDASTATPEKLRLMKALQLRKRNMLLAQRATTTPSAPSDLRTHKASDSLSTIGSSTGLSSIPSQEQLSNIDEESKLTQSSSTNSPTIMTNISEEPSTTASSFSEQDDSHTRRSLSSATSSSLTPKALVEDSKPNLQAATLNNAKPLTSSTSSPAVIENEHDSVADAKAALAYLETAPAIKADVMIPRAQTKPASEIRPSLNSAPTQRSASPMKTRRQGPPEPLRILPNGNASASDLSDDDSLIDEIHKATVHEAKPVSVARTPVTPIMSKGSSDRLREVVSRPPTTSHSAGRRSAATTPERGRSANGSLRSVSTALPQWPPLPTQPVPVPLINKKATLGTGISKRIKALEVLRTKESSPPRQTQPIRETSAGTSAFSAFMKRSSLLLNQQQPPNASTENSPPRALPYTGPHYDPHSSPALKDLRRPSAETQRPLHKGETISVTARIVRDQNSKHPPLAPSSSYNAPLNLHRSPLIVEHEKQSSANQHPSNPPRVKSPTKSDRGRFSFSSHRSASHPNLPRSESNHSKVSKSGNYNRHGQQSNSDAASIGEEKVKTSMTSRLMKRMSNLTNSRNKNQSPVKEESHQAQDHREFIRENSIAESLLHVVDIGDVNVQFPESFLWKRRFMRIDDQGFLIFSPPATEGNSKGANRKYHLGDFNRPNLPDYEREEMAWSIILDMNDGRCIQCACENRRSQQQVLQMLVDAHSAYQQLYGAG